MTDLTTAIQGHRIRGTRSDHVVRINLEEVGEGLKAHDEVKVTAHAEDGSTKTFTVLSRIDTPVEVEYYRHGGILPYVLRKLLKA